MKRDRILQKVNTRRALYEHVDGRGSASRRNILVIIERAVKNNRFTSADHRLAFNPFKSHNQL